MLSNEQTNKHTKNYKTHRFCHIHVVWKMMKYALDVSSLFMP